VFIAGWALRRSCRSPEYTALISIRARREFAGLSVVVGPAGLREVADATSAMIRDTDLIGELPDGSLGIVVSDADEIFVSGIVERLAETFSAVRFSAALSFAIGIAVSPTHSTDLFELLDYAESHPVLNVHSQASTVVPTEKLEEVRGTTALPIV